MVDGNAGKGDKYRKVDPKKYIENWEKAFPKDKKNKVLLDKASIMEAGGIIDKSGIKKPIKVSETFHPNRDKPKDKKKKGNKK